MARSTSSHHQQTHLTMWPRAGKPRMRTLFSSRLSFKMKLRYASIRPLTCCGDNSVDMHRDASCMRLSTVDPPVNLTMAAVTCRVRRIFYEGFFSRISLHDRGSIAAHTTRERTNSTRKRSIRTASVIASNCRHHTQLSISHLQCISLHARLMNFPNTCKA